MFYKVDIYVIHIFNCTRTYYRIVAIHAPHTQWLILLIPSSTSTSSQQVTYKLTYIFASSPIRSEVFAKYTQNKSHLTTCLRIYKTAEPGRTFIYQKRNKKKKNNNNYNKWTNERTCAMAGEKQINNFLVNSRGVSICIFVFPGIHRNSTWKLLRYMHRQTDRKSTFAMSASTEHMCVPDE